MTATATRYDTGTDLEYDQYGNRLSARMVWTVQGATDEDDATIAARAASQQEETGGKWMGLRYYGSTCERLTEGAYRVAIRYRMWGGYSHTAGKQMQSREWSTVSSRMVVKQLRSVRDSYHSANYPVPKGISQDLEGVVHGVEIELKHLRFVERWTFSETYWTSTYKTKLMQMVDTINDASFRGFSAGEVRFADFSAQERDDGDVEIAFSFEVSENDTVSPGATDAGTTPSLTKKGWDIEWHTTAKSATGAQVVIWAETGPVYKSKDFSDLGIGTGA